MAIETRTHALRRDMRTRRLPLARIVLLEEHIRNHLGCANCGVRKGQWCKPDYGCIETDRTVA
jgi:hypothetical protein